MLGKSLLQEGRNDAARIRQRDKMTETSASLVAQAPKRVLSRHEIRLGDVVQDVRGALLAPYISPQRKDGSFLEEDKCNFQR